MNAGHSADKVLTNRAAAPLRGPWPIDLAHTRSFRLGDVEVQPATREVVRDGRRLTLDPKIMEVLVVLAAADGAILSRDDLITACWGGRAVTDDAINRVISRLRAVSRDIGGFEVETITKVGYRLVEAEGIGPASVGSPDRDAPSVGRRAFVATGAAAAVAGAGLFAWRKPWEHRPTAEALEYFRRAELAHRMGTAEQSRQALSYYRRAVEADPLYADAWGGLALSQTHLLEGFGESELDSIPGSIRSAANRALELDPDNADAHLALVLIKPEFGNWTQMESELRDLVKRYPGHLLSNARLAVCLYEVGRLDESIDYHRKVLSIDEMLPVNHGYLAKTLSFAGQMHEADAVLDQAGRRWPAHPALWYAKYTHLLFSGRPQSAAAFVMNPEFRPSGLAKAQIDPLLTLARAVELRQPADVAAAIEDWRGMGLASPTRVLPRSATVFAMLGRPDLAFDSLERYYFNRGSFGPSIPIGRYTRRYTDLLFSQPMAPLRSDPRFAGILQGIGLEQYWRQTKTSPDYRRIA